MSTSVQKDKVAKAIANLPEPLRQRVNAIYRSGKAYRHGSRQYGKKHPATAVTDDQYVMMYIAHYKCGMPFRPMEPAFKLYPASGNDAQRCAREGKKLIRRLGVPPWVARAEASHKAAKAARKAARRETVAA